MRNTTHAAAKPPSATTKRALGVHRQSSPEYALQHDRADSFQYLCQSLPALEGGEEGGGCEGREGPGLGERERPIALDGEEREPDVVWRGGGEEEEDGDDGKDGVVLVVDMDFDSLRECNI